MGAPSFLRERTKRPPDPKSEIYFAVVLKAHEILAG